MNKLQLGARIRQISENEPISLDDLPHHDAQRLAKLRAIVNKRMELAVFTAWIDARREIGEELGIKIPAGELPR